MATTSSEPAGGLQTAPPGSRVQLTAAFHPARPDSKSGGLQNEIEAFDRARDPAEHEISFGPYRLLPARRLLLEGDKPVPIGGRALDLLIALVERPGEVVSKAELIAKVWPDTFVDEGNLKVRIAALRRALADGQGGNRYISTVVGRGYCFVAPVTRSAGSGRATAPHSAAEPLSNLPAPLMQLIGLDEVISRISAQLAHHRLITLVGPGGIGKTAVAVSTAERLIDSYEHRIWFVDLTAISDPRQLHAAVGSAIRLDISTENGSAGLLSFLSDKRMLWCSTTASISSRPPLLWLSGYCGLLLQCKSWRPAESRSASRANSHGDLRMKNLAISEPAGTRDPKQQWHGNRQ